MIDIRLLGRSYYFQLHGIPFRPCPHQRTNEQTLFFKTLI